MKTTTRFLVTAAALAAPLFGASCRTMRLAAPANAAPPQPVAVPSNWYAVREDPPVYFPVGVPEDSGTDYRHGEWIFAGEGDAMFFVPFDGNGEQTAVQLMEQAFAMRTDDQRRLIARSQRREKTTRAVGNTIGLTTVGTLTAATVVGATYGGGWVPDPGSTALAYAKGLEGSGLDSLLSAIRLSGPELYPAEVLADFQRGRSGAILETAPDSGIPGSMLIEESLHELIREAGDPTLSSTGIESMNGVPVIR